MATDDPQRPKTWAAAFTDLQRRLMHRGIPRADAEDLVQALIADVLEKYRPRDVSEVWSILRVAIEHRRIDLIRKSAAKRRLFEGAVRSTLSTPPPGPPDELERQVLREAKCILLREIANSLDPKYRRVIQTVFFCDETLRQFAEREGISRRTAQIWLRTAMHELLCALSAYGPTLGPFYESCWRPPESEVDGD